MNKIIKLSIITSSLMMFAGTANAVATYCSIAGSPNVDGLSLSDLTYNGSNSSDCYGLVSGNDSETTINGLGLTWGSDWSFLVKDDAPGITSSGSFMGIDFNLTASTGTSGDWTLSGTDTNGINPLNLPTNLDLIAALKAGNGYGLWLLDDVVFDGNDSGTWAINFANNGDQIPNLSHFSLYVREGNGGGGETEIPEPAILLLMGIGLAGIAFIRRRFKFV